MTKWKAVIIGLGKIGLSYDINYDKNNFNLTHSSAFFTNKNFELVGAVDNNKYKRKSFEKVYKIESFSSLKALSKKIKFELVAVSVPTEHLYKVCLDIIKNHSVKAIICEKPLSRNYKQAEELIHLAKKNKVLLVVNYIRRFHPNLKLFKNYHINKKFGKIMYCTVNYSKGINAYGCHFIDILIYLYGSPKFVGKEKKLKKLKNDSIGNFFLIFKNNFSVFFRANMNNKILLNNINIFYEHSILVLENGGEKIKFKKLDKNQKTHIKKFKTINFNKYQKHVIDEVDLKLKNKIKNISSSGQTALETLKVIKELNQ